MTLFHLKLNQDKHIPQTSQKRMEDWEKNRLYLSARAFFLLLDYDIAMFIG
jgi:hypothetical protein